MQYHENGSQMLQHLLNAHNFMRRRYQFIDASTVHLFVLFFVFTSIFHFHAFLFPFRDLICYSAQYSICSLVLLYNTKINYSLHPMLRSIYAPACLTDHSRSWFHKSMQNKHANLPSAISKQIHLYKFKLDAIQAQIQRRLVFHTISHHFCITSVIPIKTDSRARITKTCVSCHHKNNTHQQTSREKKSPNPNECKEIKCQQNIGVPITLSYVKLFSPGGESKNTTSAHGRHEYIEENNKK